MKSCSTAVSYSAIRKKGESGRKEKKATEQLSLSPCLVIVHTSPHAALCLRRFIMLWLVSNSWEVLSLSEEKATRPPLSEGEEGNGDRMVMRWTSSDKVLLRHLRRDEGCKMLDCGNTVICCTTTKNIVLFYIDSYIVTSQSTFSI